MEINFKQFMETVYLGEKGLSKSWQKSFKPTTKCSKCGGLARIAFVNYEGRGEKPFICSLHSNKSGAMWPHDCTATAVYTYVNDVWNQLL